MAIDEKLVTRVRSALADAGSAREVKMFGGIGFMLNGNMIAAASDRGLLVRVGERQESEALARPDQDESRETQANKEQTMMRRIGIGALAYLIPTTRGAAGSLEPQILGCRSHRLMSKWE